jgi:uncharacterized protein (TIGR02265 family)
MSMSHTPSTQPPVASRVSRPRMPDSEKMILLPLSIRLKAFDKFLTPAVREQLHTEFAAYLDQPQYPVVIGNRLVDQVCNTSLTDYSPQEARQLLGRCYIERYQESVLGRLLLAPISSNQDFEWVMRGLPRNYSAVTNYGTYWVAEVAPRHWRFDFEDDPGDPDFIMGTLLAGSEILRIPGYRVSYVTLAHQRLSFEQTWG